MELIHRLAPGMEVNGQVAFLALLVVWSLEHFFIQASAFASPPITRHPGFYQSCRLAINFLSAAIILLAFSPVSLVLVIALDFVMSVAVLAHQRYFHTPLSPFTSIGNLREGIKAAPFALRIVPRKAWILLVLLLIGKVALVLPMETYGAEAEYAARLGFLPVLLGALAMIVLALQLTSFRLSSIRKTSITRTIYAYGFTISWLAAHFLAPSRKELAQEAAASRKSSPDRLPRGLITCARGNVVIAQLENLDWNILGFSANGKEVTPYLNRLSNSSRVFRVQAYHSCGTADMDYAVLSGCVPSTRIINYSIPGLGYRDSLPRFMGGHGFRAVAIHGATGDFFGRRGNYLRMGWDEIHFREEFSGTGARESHWGVRDREIFRLSLDRLREAKTPEFHFLITLDSHGPFDLISEDEKTVFPGSRVWQENYFNSMAALDGNLSDYVESLPPDTMVILYGDHTSGVTYGGFSPAREGGVEYVPCIVHTRPGKDGVGGPADVPADVPRDLTIHDIINGMRHGIDDAAGA